MVRDMDDHSAMIAAEVVIVYAMLHAVVKLFDVNVVAYDHLQEVLIIQVSVATYTSLFHRMKILFVLFHSEE
jgi:hypothetical protein